MGTVVILESSSEATAVTLRTKQVIINIAIAKKTDKSFLMSLLLSNFS